MLKIGIIIVVILLLVLLYKIVNNAKNNAYQIATNVNETFSKYCNNPPVLNPNDYPWSSNFRNNWKDILKEYETYLSTSNIPLHSQINKYVSVCDLENKWKTLYLRAYNKDTEIAKYFPETMNLINKCPCTLAFFSVIGPHSKLEPHKGIYKGVLRYHLGLQIPKEREKCFINVNGQILNWREGEDIMFDDMFLHHVENNTNETRVILFLDIKRDFHNPILNFINSLFLKFIKSNDALKDTVDNVNKYALK